jgi:uncharacterized protein YkwD
MAWGLLCTVTMELKLRSWALALLAVAAFATGCAPGTNEEGDEDALEEEEVEEDFDALTSDEAEAKVIYWINQYRAARGKAAISGGSCVDGFAESWATKLNSTGEFKHQSLTPIINQCGASWAGETIARGNITPKQIVDLWMDSDPHRAIIMSSKPTRIGVGIKANSSGTRTVVADLIRK